MKLTDSRKFLYTIRLGGKRMKNCDWMSHIVRHHTSSAFNLVDKFSQMEKFISYACSLRSWKEN